MTYTVKIGHMRTDLYPPTELFPQIKSEIDKAEKNGFDFLNVEITAPVKPKSTGSRSQNSRFMGHCRDISEQLRRRDGNPLWTPREIREAILWMAVENGYPTKYDLVGRKVPMDWGEASREDAQIAQKTLEAYADQHRLWLHEKDDMGRPYKTIGGLPVTEEEEIW